MKRWAAAFRRRVAIPLLAVSLAGCAASVLPSVHSEPERLALAHRLAAKREWGSAIELLKTYIERNAGSAQVDEAIYLLGHCYLRSKDYPNAQVEFERLLRDYPESDSSGSAAYRLGEALRGQSRPADFDQDFTMRALEQWQHYLRDYPGHWLNAEAEVKIAQTRVQLASKLLATGQLYLKLKEFEPARVYFARVEQEYGDTPLLGEALIGLARCDALEGHRADALARLEDLETRFKGEPLAARAARERAWVEHLRAPKPVREAHRVPEPQP